jgi:serine phosphatase RsbU (regulator of sigma subunit)
MPVEFGGQTLGTLAVTRPASAPAFTGGEVELLQAVADFIGIARATENLWQERTKRLGLEQEIQVAANIQRSLLPAAFPVGTRWHIHGACRPAREVGGDYFDVVALPDGGALLLIADVMGKGVPAALLAAMLRSSLRALSAVETAPDRILTGINRQLFPDLVGLGMFITAVLVALPADPARPVFFANAGHCAPAVLRPDGSIHEAPGGDVPLGILPDTPYHAHPCPLGPRDRLFLYTDGCYELNGPDGQMLGPDRFLRLAADRLALPPSAFVAALLDPVALHLDPAAISDDRTLLVATPSS